ncbi:sigma-70 family RNA polymerase sigma factor [soil metagenome]
MDASELTASSAPAPDRLGGTGQPQTRTGVGEFEELFRRYEPGIGRFLAQMVSDRALAADLTQETFASALGARNQLESIENPEAWLFRIARNCALQSFRKRSRAVNAIKRLSHERRDEVADPAEAIEVRDQLMRTLKPDERSVLILRYVHGFSSQELAEIVGRSPEAIRKELSRSRRKLIESMDAPTSARAEKE